MRVDISVDSKQSHMTGVQFPVTDEALKNLVDLKEKKLSLVQLVSRTFKNVNDIYSVTAVLHVSTTLNGRTLRITDFKVRTTLYSIINSAT